MNVVGHMAIRTLDVQRQKGNRDSCSTFAEEQEGIEAGRVITKSWAAKEEREVVCRTGWNSNHARPQVCQRRVHSTQARDMESSRVITDTASIDGSRTPQETGHLFLVSASSEEGIWLEAWGTRRCCAVATMTLARLSNWVDVEKRRC